MNTLPLDLFTRIGFSLDDPALIQEIFTHRSAMNENPHLSRHNERLEFLGDAVLELVTTNFLFHKFPQKPEGELTNIRSALVRGDHLAQIARKLELGQYLILSRGESRSGGSEKDYLLANLVEALIGAIYIDKGLEMATSFIRRFVLDDLDDIMSAKGYIDVKSAFQELVQDKIGITPHYELYSEDGMDHDKTFVIDAFIGDLKVGRGIGKSKKEAQSHAAQEALSHSDHWISLLVKNI